MSWTPEHFVRRSYGAKSPEFDRVDPRSIRLRVLVGKQVVADFQAREPGLLAFVSRPDDSGFAMELVEPGHAGFHDLAAPDGSIVQRPSDWQLVALGLTS